jgi:hypothetical protein
VAISGNTVVIGAPSKSGGGEVYVFILNGSTWIEQAEFTDHLGVSGHHFGLSVAIGGNTVVVGDVDFSVGITTGAVLLFTRTGDIWTEEQSVTGSPIGVGLGRSVAISGNTVIAGGAGFANVYQVSGGQLLLQQTLSSGSSSFGDFGGNVAIDGNTLAVSAQNFGPPIGINGPNPQGAFFVYSYSGGTWTVVLKATFPTYYVFRTYTDVPSLSLKGDTLVVEVSDTNTGEITDVIVDKLNGNTWTQQQDLSNQDLGNFDNLVTHNVLSNVAVSSDTILFGAPGAQVGSNAGQGAAFFQNANLAYAVADFQGHGVWRYTDLGGWQPILAADASLVAIDDHGSVAAVFPNGLWRYDDASGWIRLTPAGASEIDIAGNGIVVADFPGNGLWRYGDLSFPGGGWDQLTPASALSIAVDDQGDTVASFQGNGVFLYQDQTGWQLLTAAVAGLCRS